jgi:hypothetical protein
MKILLQHTGSGLFYKGLGIWVPDEVDARVFVSALDAIEFCQQQGLSSVEIVHRSDEPQNDIRVGPLQEPLPPRDRPAL